MNRTTFLSVFLLLAAGCTGGGDPAPGPSADLTRLAPTTWILRVGSFQEVGPLRITFAAVPEDSRCPPGRACLLAGNAVVELIAEHTIAKVPARRLRLNTGQQPRSEEAFGVQVTLEALRPEPGVAGDYSAVLRLRGANVADDR